MKNLLIIILVCVSGRLFADDLLLRDGAILQNVTIISADPVRMLIAHDGGGCQVKYTDLASNVLSAQQRATMESKLEEYVERRARIDQYQLEKKIFEQGQLEKGLILFEDHWMSPAERQELLVQREKKSLELEKLRLELAKEKVELQKQELLARQGDQLLEPPRSSYFFYSSGHVGNRWCGYGHPGYSWRSNKRGTWNSIGRTPGVNISVSSRRRSVVHESGSLE
jgi:hypothetical protein